MTALAAPAERVSPEPNYLQGVRTHIAEAKVEARGWTESWAAPVAVAEAPNGFGEETWPVAQDVNIIAWRMRGSVVVCELPKHSGRRTVAGDGKINLQLAGTPARYSAHGPIRFGHFYLRDDLLNRVADGLGVVSKLRDDLLMTPDRELWAQLEAYASRACDPLRPASRIELEARALLIVERLMGAHHDLRVSAPAKGGLAAWQIKRACDAMAASLDCALGLDELAALSGCSPAHFSRAFKQSMGVSPFRWLDQRRVEAAKALLEGGRLPLTEIALAVGFAAQPRFTTAFRRLTGVTPGVWRRERAS